LNKIKGEKIMQCYTYYKYYLKIKKIILINKFSKHNQVNVPSFDIKYLDLHPSLDFSSFIF
jgi:hypothetical protein